MVKEGAPEAVEGRYLSQNDNRVVRLELPHTKGLENLSGDDIVEGERLRPPVIQRLSNRGNHGSNQPVKLVGMNTDLVGCGRLPSRMSDSSDFTASSQPLLKSKAISNDLGNNGLGRKLSSLFAARFASSTNVFAVGN